MAKIKSVTDFPDYNVLAAEMVDFADLEGAVITVHKVEWRKSQFEEASKENYMVLTITVGDDETLFCTQTTSNAVERYVKSAEQHNLFPFRFLLGRRKTAYTVNPAP